LCGPEVGAFGVDQNAIVVPQDETNRHRQRYDATRVGTARVEVHNTQAR
jgi:hypothetical protein